MKREMSLSELNIYYGGVCYGCFKAKAEHFYYYGYYSGIYCWKCLWFRKIVMWIRLHLDRMVVFGKVLNFGLGRFLADKI